MICYRDMTFCARRDCLNTECLRLITPTLEKEAADFGLGLAIGDMKTTTCGHLTELPLCRVSIFSRYDPDARCSRRVKSAKHRYCWQHTAIANNIDWRGDRR